MKQQAISQEAIKACNDADKALKNGEFAKAEKLYDESERLALKSQRIKPLKNRRGRGK